MDDSFLTYRSPVMTASRADGRGLFADLRMAFRNLQAFRAAPCSAAHL